MLTALRSNYSFAMIPGEKRKFGKCDMEIEGRKAEPPPDKRGHIARTYFYMDWAYPGHGIISKKNRKLFEAGNVRGVEELKGFRGMRIGL
jgi:deoxyribonuclease I